MCDVKLLVYSENSTVQPLKFLTLLVISSYTLLGVYMVGLKLIHVDKWDTGPTAIF